MNTFTVISRTKFPSASFSKKMVTAISQTRNVSTGTLRSQRTAPLRSRRRVLSTREDSVRLVAISASFGMGQNTSIRKFARTTCKDFVLKVPTANLLT